MMEYWNTELTYDRDAALGEQASCLFGKCTGRMPVLPVWRRLSIPSFQFSNIPMRF